MEPVYNCPELSSHPLFRWLNSVFDSCVSFTLFSKTLEEWQLPLPLLKEWKGRPLHLDRWPDVTPEIALPSKGKVQNRNKTNCTMKSNKFHFTYMCFGGRKNREERKTWLKVRLLGLPNMLPSRSARPLRKGQVSGFILIGPLNQVARC